jgi:enoyl-CoA hydratase/carnithine racemase
VILADQRTSAVEAYEWGLVEEVTDPGGAFDAAMILAAKVAAQPPLSVAMTKKPRFQGRDATIDSSFIPSVHNRRGG